jgi:hypothetical protein
MSVVPATRVGRGLESTGAAGQAPSAHLRNILSWPLNLVMAGAVRGAIHSHDVCKSRDHGADVHDASKIPLRQDAVESLTIHGAAELPALDVW